jgi:hypothetical protein
MRGKHIPWQKPPFPPLFRKKAAGYGSPACFLIERTTLLNGYLSHRAHEGKSFLKERG